MSLTTRRKLRSQTTAFRLLQNVGFLLKKTIIQVYPNWPQLYNFSGFNTYPCILDPSGFEPPLLVLPSEFTITCWLSFGFDGIRSLFQCQGKPCRGNMFAENTNNPLGSNIQFLEIISLSQGFGFISARGMLIILFSGTDYRNESFFPQNCRLGFPLPDTDALYL